MGYKSRRFKRMVTNIFATSGESGGKKRDDIIVFVQCNLASSYSYQLRCRRHQDNRYVITIPQQHTLHSSQDPLAMTVGREKLADWILSYQGRPLPLRISDSVSCARACGELSRVAGNFWVRISYKEAQRSPNTARLGPYNILAEI
jgi:hypothetical protein